MIGKCIRKVVDKMETNLEIFNNSSFGELIVLVKNNVAWFIGKNIANALGYKDTKSALSDHVDKEDKEIFKGGDLPLFSSQTSTFKIPNRGLTIINESGLFSLILSSKLPAAKKFKRWVTSEVLPSIRKTGSYTINKLNNDELKIKQQEVEARLKEANRLTAELWLRLGDRTNIKEYKQIAESYAANTLAGTEVFALPEVTKTTYSATEIGKMLNISANKVGSLANKNNLKTEEYGKWFYDKSRYSNKEVETFKYYDCVIPVLSSLLNR